MPRRKPKPAPRRTARRALAAPPPSPRVPTIDGMTPTQIVAARHLFWENVIREILTSLSTICSMHSQTPPPPGDEHAAEAKADAAARGEPEYDPTLFDGRLAVITKGGERVAIAQVMPLFACGINTPQERGLSIALECTVFQISTPDGHVYTLPLHEIRAFHALTPELMRRLERSARRRQATARAQEVEDQPPFGFAAFTSLMQPARPSEPAPSHPTE